MVDGDVDVGGCGSEGREEVDRMDRGLGIDGDVVQRGRNGLICMVLSMHLLCTAPPAPIRCNACLYTPRAFSANLPSLCQHSMQYFLLHSVQHLAEEDTS